MERRNIDSITFPFSSLFDAVLISSLGTRSGTGPLLPSNQSGSTELTSEERMVRVVDTTGWSSRRRERVPASEGRSKVPSERRSGRSAC